MNSKLLYLSIILGVLISAPNYLNAQAKSLSDYKIIKNTLSAEESSALNSPEQSPSKTYRLEREKSGYSIIENKTGFKYILDVPGRIRISSWSKVDRTVLFNISHIPVGNGKFTGAVGIYSFKDKRTKIFRSDKYLLMHLRLSPDGKTIIATGSTSEKGYIIALDIESGNLKEITDVVSTQPTWVPNSNKVAYVQWGDRKKSAIILADLDTDEKFTIVESSPYLYFYISPDGKKLAFTSPGGGFLKELLSKIDIDGTNLVKIATFGSWAHVVPRWSPDSRFIAYKYPLTKNHHGKAMSSDIYIYEVSTNSKRNLTAGAAGLYNFKKWNEDNSLIISFGANEDIYQSYKLEE